MLVALALALVLVAGFAPYVYAEYEFTLRGHVEPLGPKPVQPVAGRWFDDYFVVETIDPSTFAIGEPRYYQGNYSYLIVGTARAVLFDAGTVSRLQWLVAICCALVMFVDGYDIQVMALAVPALSLQWSVTILMVLAVAPLACVGGTLLMRREWQVG
jgi:hypothetical protein